MSVTKYILLQESVGPQLLSASLNEELALFIRSPIVASLITVYGISAPLAIELLILTCSCFSVSSTILSVSCLPYLR